MNTREEQAAGGPTHAPPEAGGRGRGKGQTRPQRRHPYQAASRLPVPNQRLPEILDGRHPPGGSQPEISFLEETQGAPERRKPRPGPRRGEGALHPGRACPSSSWLPAAQPSLRLCGAPENPNLSGSGLVSARNAGPAPCRAAGSLSSVDGESTHP